MEYIETRIKGKSVPVPSAQIAGRTIMTTGGWLKIAAARDEELVEGEIVQNPESFIFELKRSGLKADILTFPQHFQEMVPKHPYFFEWDNAAVARTESVGNWWKKLPQETRKNARRAAKRGVSVQVARFDDEFVRGIKEIYDETPVRQGMRFWHFGKDLEQVRMENGTYLERSEFIGAYCGRELIGFMKFVYADRTARIMQILSKTSQYDKRPMNALIAKAVEVCNQKGMAYLVYSKFTFGNKAVSQLTQFKHRNGFEKVLFPRYYVPLTWKGRLALKLRLHRGLLGILPPRLITVLWQLRASLLKVGMRTVTHDGPDMLSQPEERLRRSVVSVGSVKS
jgi:hypothetical protein